jgi:hypothetical protein
MRATLKYIQRNCKRDERAPSAERQKDGAIRPWWVIGGRRTDKLMPKCYSCRGIKSVHVHIVKYSTPKMGCK